MPIGTCDPASRGEAFNTDLIEVRSDDGGHVLVEYHWTWDGVSTRATGCDGPVIYIRTRNDGTTPAWALLPDKKRGDPWIAIPPGTDVITTAQGQINNLGLSNASDMQRARVSFVNPA